MKSILSLGAALLVGCSTPSVRPTPAANRYENEFVVAEWTPIRSDPSRGWVLESLRVAPKPGQRIERVVLEATEDRERPSSGVRSRLVATPVPVDSPGRVGESAR